MTGGLTFNGVSLIAASADPVTGARIRAVGDGLSFGTPEAVIASIQSQLQDGDLERIDRFGNREASIQVMIDAPGSPIPGAAVALGQQALERACGFSGWAEMVWTSPMDGAEASVFEVTSASISTTFDDLREQRDDCRYVTLTIHARPFVRPTTKDTFDAPATVGSTTTSVDTGSATTGWSLLSTTPSPVHNLSPNPSFETNTTGWSGGAGTASIARDTARALVGSASLKMTESVTAGRSYCTSPASVVTAGSTYPVVIGNRGSIDVPNSGGGCIVRFYSDTAASVQVGSDWTTTFPSSSTFTFRTFTTPAAPATAIRMRLLVFGNANVNFVGGAGEWWLDPAAPFDSAVAGYFDGATTATTALTFSWDGTAHLSTSTATWTAPTLAVVGGTAVQGTVYGRSSASIRRNNTGITAAAMASLPYLRIRGTASAFSDGQVTIADNGGGAITPTSYNYNQTTGAYDILIQRAAGFTNLDVTFTRTGGTISTTTGLFINVDQIDITDNPFSSGKVQTRQISIGGSQRTELSLSVLGLDAAGTTPVALGEQVLIHTAAAGGDSRAKFLACRGASGLAGTSDATATSGVYNALNTTGTPTNFTFSATALLPGNYLVVPRLMPTTTGAKVINFRGFVDPTTGDNAYDPPGGTLWKTCPLAVGASGWPTIAQNAWGMLPVGLLLLPPADLEDTGATITIQFAADTASVVRVDDVFLLNADTGQASLVRTDISGGSYSAVRLDAATVANPDPSVWVGVANGVMMSDPTRIQGFEQHKATPGLLQVSSVTPNCSTSRLAGSYYRRYGHDVAPGA